MSNPRLGTTTLSAPKALPPLMWLSTACQIGGSWNHSPPMGFLFTATMGKLFTMTMGIQLTVSPIASWKRWPKKASTPSS